MRAILEAGAADERAEVRATALSALVRVDPAPGGGPWGPRGRWDPDEGVRRAVADALATRPGDPAALALLRGLASAPEVDGVTRGHAADRALLLDADATWLAPLLTGPDDWGTAGVLLVAVRGGEPDLVARAAAWLDRGEVPLDARWWELLARTGASGLRPSLVALLPRLEPEVHPRAVAALLRLDPQGPPTGLADVLAAGPDAALDLVEALAESPGEVSARLLGRLADSAPSPADVVAATRLLALGDAPGALQARVVDPDRDVRRAAIEASGTLLGRGVVPPSRLREALLATALAAEEWGERRAAVRAVARGPDRERLRSLLDDAALDLRVEVAAALLRTPSE